MNKLREKFSEIIVRTHITPFEQGEQCEQITDDFAVKFTEWLKKEVVITRGNVHKLSLDGEVYNLTELLQIFKDKYYE